jgi:hypothetical protein
VLEARIRRNVSQSNIGKFLAKSSLFGFGEASGVDGERSSQVLVVDDDVDAVAGGGAAVVTGVSSAVAGRGGWVGGMGVLGDVIVGNDVDFFIDLGAIDSDGVVFGFAVLADQGGDGERVFLWLVSLWRIRNHAGDAVIGRLDSWFWLSEAVLAHRADELLLPGGLLLLLLSLELVLLLKLHLANVVEIVHCWVVVSSGHLSHFED